MTPLEDTLVEGMETFTVKLLPSINYTFSAGSGIGLLISLGLTWAGKMKRSFAEGWPELEVDQHADAPIQDAKPGVIARVVGGWIDRYRGALTGECLKTMVRQQAAADTRDKTADATVRRRIVIVRPARPGFCRGCWLAFGVPAHCGRGRSCNRLHGQFGGWQDGAAGVLHLPDASRH